MASEQDAPELAFFNECAEEQGELVPPEHKPLNQVDRKIQEDFKALMQKLRSSFSVNTPSTTNHTANLTQLLKCDPTAFLQLCEDTLSETEGTNQIESRASEDVCMGDAPTYSEGSPNRLEESQYDNLEPVLAKADVTMALQEKRSDFKMRISTLGKELFNVLFDEKETIKVTQDFEKAGIIAGFLGWLISRPRDFTIQSFMLYDASLKDMIPDMR